MSNTITVNLDVQSTIRAVLSKEWINELIEQAKIKPEDGGDVFLHTVYKHSHSNDPNEVYYESDFDAELFAKTVFSNGIRKFVLNALSQFMAGAGGVAGTVSPAKLRYTEVPAAERARLLRMESEKPKLPEVPSLPAPFVPAPTEQVAVEYDQPQVFGSEESKADFGGSDEQA